MWWTVLFLQLHLFQRGIPLKLNMNLHAPRACLRAAAKRQQVQQWTWHQSSQQVPMIITRMRYESLRSTARQGARPNLDRRRERERESDRKWFLNVTVRHQKVPATASHEEKRKCTSMRRVQRMQKATGERVRARIFSNRIHPRPFLRCVKLKHTLISMTRGGGGGH